MSYCVVPHQLQQALVNISLVKKRTRFLVLRKQYCCSLTYMKNEEQQVEVSRSKVYN